MFGWLVGPEPELDWTALLISEYNPPFEILAIGNLFVLVVLVLDSPAKENAGICH